MVRLLGSNCYSPASSHTDATPEVAVDVAVVDNDPCSHKYWLAVMILVKGLVF